MQKSLTSYDILNVTPDSSQADIHCAYRMLAKKWHPDSHHNGNRDRANANFKLLQEAYNNLKTQESRAKYNRLLAVKNQTIMAYQNKVLNDNAPLSGFFKTLETLFVKSTERK
jgi:curved DNA-binding protein CbpA